MGSIKQMIGNNNHNYKKTLGKKTEIDSSEGVNERDREIESDILGSITYPPTPFPAPMFS